MAFQEAVEAATEPVRSAYQSGKQALKREHRNQIECKKPRNLTGSIDLDRCLEQDKRHTQSNRWDYGLGYICDNTEIAIWIEVHPATTSEVHSVIKKLEWLKDWLSNEAAELESMTDTSGRIKAFHWLATSGVHIRPGTPQERRLRAAGLDSPRRVLRLI